MRSSLHPDDPVRFNDLDAGDLLAHLKSRLHTLPTESSSARLESGRSGIAARLRLPNAFRIRPQLTYGRHRGVVAPGSRIAAVALMLYWHPDLGWSLTLTRRPTTLSHHGGQVCLPGGRIEPGESVVEACLREYTEELGVDPVIHAVAGCLDTHLVYASGNLVWPVVLIGDPPTSRWKPDPVEVAEVIEAPMQEWLTAENRSTQRLSRTVRSDIGEKVDELNFLAPVVNLRARTFRSDPNSPSGLAEFHESHSIWGATAMMIEQLARILLL